MLLRQVCIRDANQNFSQYIHDVEKGEGLIITRRGKAVAKIVPIEKTAERILTPEQEAAMARSIKRMKKGAPLGIKKFNRDEAHER